MINETQQVEYSTDESFKRIDVLLKLIKTSIKKLSLYNPRQALASN